MIEALLIALRLTIEVVLSCHCNRWVLADGAWRCPVPIDYHPRCELIEGWHLAAPGVSTCSRNCGEDP